MRYMFAVLFIPNGPQLPGPLGNPLVLALIVIVLLAIVVAIIGLLMFRGGKSKQNANAAAPGGVPDWQRQGQPTDNAWGQQPGGWGAQGVPQQPGAWGAQGVPQQQQPGGWGAQGVPQQPGAWGAQGVPQQQQQPGGWGAQGVPQQPQQADPWGGQNAPQPQAGAWGSQPTWDAAPSSSARDSRGQSQPLPPQSQQQSQPAWGSPSAASASSQPAPTSYGGGQAWGPTAQPADPWATPSPQQPQPAQQGGWPQSFQQQSSSPIPADSNSAAPPWQQQGAPLGGGFGQVGAAQEPTALYGSGEADRTMLRNTGPQGRLGIVRVEEGKDPGRVYEVRKDSLSIGRSRESDIFLEDLAVSRLHASIVNMGNGNYGLKDEGSANGTKINGQLVPKNQMYPLQEGDKIQLGQTVLVFGKR